MEKMNTVQTLFPNLPERLAGLEELAENLWWSWNPGAPDYRAMPWPTVKERKSGGYLKKGSKNRGLTETQKQMKFLSLKGWKFQGVNG